MASRTFTALMIAAGAWLAAGPALAQDLKLRPGTDRVDRRDTRLGQPHCVESMEVGASRSGWTA